MRNNLNVPVSVLSLFLNHIHTRWFSKRQKYIDKDIK